MEEISIEFLTLFPKGKESLEATFFSSSKVLLENGSMVHNQTKAERLRKLSATFLENE